MPKSQLPPLVVLGTWATDPELAVLLGSRLGGRPVIGIEPPADEVADRMRRVEDWVAHHMDRMEQLDLGSPTHLLGYSFGGVLALEMARDPRWASSVRSVGLIDTIRPSIRPLRLRDAVPYHLFEAALLPDRDTRRRYLVKELKRRVVQVTPTWVLQTRRKLLGYPPLTTKQTFAKPTSPLVRAIHRSYLNYQARPTTLPVHIYATDGSIDRCKGDPSLGWAPFLKGGFTVANIGGTHTTLGIEPHVDGLAAVVRSHLDAVDPRD